MTPGDILRHALKGHDDAMLTALAADLDIAVGILLRAANGAHGQPTRVDHHIRICAWLGIHPLTGLADPPRRRRVSFDAGFFAMAVKIARFGNMHSLRQAAKAAGLSHSVFTRIEQGNPRSMDSIVAAARYAGTDPCRCVVDNVSRGTSETKVAAVG